MIPIVELHPWISYHISLNLQVVTTSGSMSPKHPIASLCMWKLRGLCSLPWIILLLKCRHCRTKFRSVHRCEIFSPSWLIVCIAELCECLALKSLALRNDGTRFVCVVQRFSDILLDKLKNFGTYELDEIDKSIDNDLGPIFESLGFPIDVYAALLLLAETFIPSMQVLKRLNFPSKFILFLYKEWLTSNKKCCLYNLRATASKLCFYF